MASTLKRNGGMEGAWIFQLLSPLYPGLRVHCKTTAQTHTEGSRMAVGTRGAKGF